MRFSVACRTQNALFRRVRLSSPAQTSTRLTERRILYLPPHGKAHSVPTTSRKSAFCTHHLTEKRILYPPPHGKAHSGPTQPQGQGLRARRLPAEIGLELGGRLRQYAHEELAGQAKPIDPNGTIGPWRPTGYGPTTIMASTPHGRCRIRWRRVGRDPPSQTAAGA